MITGTATLARSVADLLVGSLADFSADNTGRYCDNAVAEDHDHGGQGLAEIGLWRDITIADRGHGDDGPVNTAGYTGKAVCFTFDDIDQGAEDDHQGQNRKKKNRDFTAAGP